MGTRFRLAHYTQSDDKDTEPPGGFAKEKSFSIPLCRVETVRYTSCRIRIGPLINLKYTCVEPIHRLAAQRGQGLPSREETVTCVARYLA